MESRTTHRVLHCLMGLSIATSELVKVAWSRVMHHGIGYWWVRADGFSTGGFCCEVLLDSAALLVLVTIFLQIPLAVLEELPRGDLLSKSVHTLIAMSLSVLGVVDAALFIGAGGARVSLPLVLFALGEMEYVVHVVRPWIRVGFVGLVFLGAMISLISAALLNLVTRFAPHKRVSWNMKFIVMAVCLGKLQHSGRKTAGPGGDLLSQLGIDAVALLKGTLPDKEQEDVLAAHRTYKVQDLEQFPPVLLFHWEAASSDLFTMSRASNCTATPFMCQMSEREEVVSLPMHVSVPMTIKTAWEVLCGTPPALTSDFREQGSALRRQCLPRVLSDCCGYWSILAKTDTQLPDLPRRVFGFNEVLVAPSSSALLALLRARLHELGALSGRQPVFVYYYADEAHAPYTPDRITDSEGYHHHGAEDVFLALHRQTDSVASQLAHFWPPPRNSSVDWAVEHGLAMYFGDHGEELYEDAPPHGNVVSRTVTEVQLQVDLRSYAKRSVLGGLRRPADIYATLLDVAGMRADGELHVGRSLFRTGHGSSSTASFYRPSEVVAVRSEDNGTVNTVEFERSRSGWTITTMSSVPSGVGALVGAKIWSDDADACGLAVAEQARLKQQAYDGLDQALAKHQHVNRLLTTSNIHAAWLVAKMSAAAAKARAAAKAAMRLARFVLSGALLTAK